MRSFPETQRLFAACDAAWQHELDRLFGPAGYGARFLACGKGALNSRLRARWEAREDALRERAQALRTYGRTC